jgi:hypothetical protein
MRQLCVARAPIQRSWNISRRAPPANYAFSAMEYRTVATEIRHHGLKHSEASGIGGGAHLVRNWEGSISAPRLMQEPGSLLLNGWLSGVATVYIVDSCNGKRRMSSAP